MKLLKGDNSTKELTPVKVPSFIQSFAARNTNVNIPPKFTSPPSSNAPRVQLPEGQQQAPARTFKFLGKEITLPNVTTEKTFFAPSRFLNTAGHSNGDYNARNEFEFEL